MADKLGFFVAPRRRLRSRHDAGNIRILFALSANMGGPLGLGVRLLLDVLEVLEVPRAGAEGQLLGNEEVARVPIGDVTHVASTAAGPGAAALDLGKGGEHDRVRQGAPETGLISLGERVAADIEAALNALPSIGGLTVPASVTVRQAPHPLQFTVTFGGSLSSADVTAITGLGMGGLANPFIIKQPTRSMHGGSIAVDPNNTRIIYFATGENPGRLGSAHPSIVPYQAFATADGYVNVAVGSEAIWTRFCEVVDPTLARDPRYRGAAHGVVARAVAPLRSLAELARGYLGDQDEVATLAHELRILRCAQYTGVAAGALDLAADHGKQREQFGAPIGTFQAVAHRLADAWLDVHLMQSTHRQAAWRTDHGLPAGQATASAALWACEGGQRVVHAAQHIHAGVGMDLDYPVHRFFRWAKELDLAIGGSGNALATLGAALAAEPLMIG